MPEVEILLPKETGSRSSFEDSLLSIKNAGNLQPFGKIQLDFAGALSLELTQSPEARRHPELVALGFWLRPAHLRQMIDKFNASHPDGFFLPRGICFHIAPANVDSIFVYSWLISLICGNRNLIRLSSRGSIQSDCLLNILNGLLLQSAWTEIARRVGVFKYGHDDSINRRLTSICDVRVVWGGDQSVGIMRSFPLSPTATELCFPNKFSLAVLDSTSVCALSDLEVCKLAKRFASDAYTFGQMACSSPRLVLWLGNEEETRLAQERFWREVEHFAQKLDHGLTPVDFVNKRIATDLLAMDRETKLLKSSNLLRRIWLQKPEIIDENHCGSGLFHEAGISRLEELLPLLTRRVQTLSYFGIKGNSWRELIRVGLPVGLDRIVPIGKALDFNPVWDGLNLWRSFLREIDLI